MKKSDPKNALALYQFVTVLLAEGKVQQALEEAQVLRSLAPGEASVPFLLAKVLFRSFLCPLSQEIS